MFSPIRSVSSFALLTLLFVPVSVFSQGNNYPAVTVSETGNVYVVSSNENGLFSGWTQIWSMGSGNSRGITLGNFNNDNYPDVITGRGSSNTVTLYILKGLPGGNFSTPLFFGTFSGANDWCMDMASGDFNEDGIDDLAVNTNSATTALFISTSSGSFTNSTVSWNGSNGRGMDVGDFNNDGHLDIVRGENSGGIITLYQGNGTGSFTRLRDIGDAGTDPYGVTAADFNGDGKMDVIAEYGSNGDPTCWKGNGDGTFTAGVRPEGLDLDNHSSYDAYDYNHDGFVDIVATNYSGQQMYFVPGLGTGNFGPKVLISQGSPGNILTVSALPYIRPGLPLASFTPLTATIAAGNSVNFDGTGSNGNDLTWTWNFGDGDIGSGAVIDHTFSEKGWFHPLLKLSNASGLFNTIWGEIKATGDVPIADAGGPYTFAESNALQNFWTGILDASATINDGGSDAKYLWNFMPEISIADSFPESTIDGNKWRFANCSQSGGVLRVGTANLGSWGSAYFESQNNFQRREGLTLYIRYKAVASENIMFGFKTTNTNHNYTELYHAFYPNGTSLNVYESGSNRGNFRTLVYGTWYDFKLELKPTGADYWFKPSYNQSWERIYQSTYQCGAEIKAAICGYQKGQNEFDDFYLGNIETGKQITHSFYGAGTYPVILTVTDFLGQSSTASTTVATRGDQPPVAATGGPYLLDEHAASQNQWTVQLNGSGSTDDHGIWEYQWNFGDGTTGTGVSPSHTYTSRGPHTVTLTVKDHAGLTDSDQGIVSFSMNNQPVAGISAPVTINESAARNNVWTAQFSGSPSRDDVGIWKYEWNFGDGGTASGRDVSHGFSRTGTYTVTLIVYDHAGQSASATHQISVIANNAPVARITAPQYVDEANAKSQKWSASFNSNGSTDDFGLWKYLWNFGDGTATSTEAAPIHQFAAVGTYTVNLTVWDNAGQSASTQQAIEVRANQPPVATIIANPLTVEGSQSVNFDATSSSDDFGIDSYLWNFGTVAYNLSGSDIDAATWKTRGNVSQNNGIVTTGSSAWGANGFYSVDQLFRGSVFTATVKTGTGNQNAMTGFKNVSTDVNYNQFPYALYFNNGTLNIYENGNSRANVGTYTRGNTYDVRIEALPGTGALYQYRLSGSALWTTLYTSTFAFNDPMCIGMDVYAGTFIVSEASINKKNTQAKWFSSFAKTTDVTLTVTDNAGQNDTTVQTITVITSQSPVAVITAPVSFTSNLDVPFNGSRSTDDYGIASYVWNFGDGSAPAYGPQTSHSYASGGNYTVSLTVKDFAGQTGTVTHAIAISGGQIVRAVPWQFSNGIEIPHDSWNGKEITLKAVANTAALPFTYTWNFGDGSATVSGTITTREESCKLQARHTYSGTSGTPYVATITVVDNNGITGTDTYPIVIREKTLDVETNVAIDEALWFLHRNQERYESNGIKLGRWRGYGGYYANISASALQSFEINGHSPSGDPLNDPYVETAQRGLDFLFTILTHLSISAQPAGNPDGNNNGIGLTINESYQPYQVGAVMDAIIASNTPYSITRTGSTNVQGRRFIDIVQDLADIYSWGQVDAGSSYRGGWRYNWNSDADNSAAQWGAIGLIPAERNWGVIIPQFVKDENRYWTNYSYWSGGGFGYTGSGSDYQTSPCGMVQLAFNGTSTSDQKWIATEQWMANNWTGFRNANTTYGYYAFTKAMRLALPAPVVNLRPNNFDWYSNPTTGLRRTLIDRQKTDGSWLSNHSYPSEYIHNTAWTTIILTPTLFEIPPVAIATATPNPGAIGQIINFDGNQSYHLDPFHKVISYAWDFNASDGLDWNNPDATGPTAAHAYNALGTYTATLRVGDDYDPPHYVTATIPVKITIPPHPPTALPGGPYIGVVNEPVALDGSNSYDIDQSLGDVLTFWGWEIDLENPRDFNDAIGPKPAGVVYTAPGTYNLGLRVTDNTVIAFPSSGQPNLTNDAYTTVTISDPCISDLAARAKEIKVTLTWTNNNAAPYTIMRSTQGANAGFTTIGTTSNTYSTFTDYNVQKNIRYYYRVKDANGCLSIAASVVPTTRSTNRPPVITSTPVDTAREGRLYTYDCNATDADNNQLTYVLDQAPTGMTINNSTGLVSFNPDFTQVGNHPVAIRVSDAVSSRVQFYTLHVFARVNLPPAPVIDAPAAGISGMVITFNATRTIDPENDLPLSFTWNFGDGQTGNGSMVQHAFNAAGTYVISLFASDNRGATASIEHTIVINDPNRKPTAVPGGPYVGEENMIITFDGSGSSDPDADTLTYTWYFGDETQVVHGAVAEHKFTTFGVYHATLEVNDGKGASDAVPFDIVISLPNSAPVAAIVPSATYGNVGNEFAFDATQSSDQDGDELIFTWQFGDGSSTTGNRVTHVFNVAGHFDVTLVADDQKGKTGSTQVAVHINAPPVFTSSAPSTTAEDAPFIYQAIAEDPDGDALTYSLLSAIEGMTIDGGTGRVFWIPENEDVGTHVVELQVSDGHERWATQRFNLQVTNINDNPSFTSTPVAEINEGAAYGYNADAEDVDIGDTVTYLLSEFPEGMIIDAASGSISWTPDHADIGDQQVTIGATDRNGGSATQSFTLHVNELPWPPVFTSNPVLEAVEDQQYSYQATATDPNTADILKYLLVNGPAGLSIDSITGLVTWTPVNEQVDANTIKLRVSDGTLTTDQEYTVSVSNTNDAPTITSTPPVKAQVNVQWSYKVGGEDVDQTDHLTYSLVNGSGNAAIDPQSGILIWTPGSDEEGEHSFTVRATDIGGASADQTFTVKVQLQPEPPVFITQPDTIAVEDQLYSYQAGASDPNGDELTFALTSGPEGFKVTSSGLATFTPTNRQVGRHNIVISVSDGMLSVNQIYTLIVSNVNDNPEITSSPVTSVSQGEFYSYQVIATDPDGDALTYTLTAAPSGMTVSPAGLISWPDDGQRVDGQSVALEVTDNNGGTSMQTWSVAIVNDIVPPVVSVTLSSNPVKPGQSVTITINASDNVGIKSRSLSISGTPVVLEGNSYIYQAVSEGNVQITGSATDLSGNTGSANATLMVSPTADNTPPVVNLAYSPAQPAVGQQVTFNVSAIDDNGIDNERLWLKVNDKYIPVVDGTAHYVAQMKGSVTALATAYDLSGNYGQNLVRFNVKLDGNDNTVPAAVISSPDDDTVITKPINLVGTANDANFAYYILSYATRDNPYYIEYYRSTTPVNNDILGKIDPTLLENGIYLFKLTVYDKYGNFNSTTVQVQADGQMKMGNFSLSFNDLKYETPGLSLEIIRTYDSRVKTKEDFGYGWSLGLKHAAKIQENRVPGHGWQVECHRELFGMCIEWTVMTENEHYVLINLPGIPKQEFDIEVVCDYAEPSGIAQGNLTFKARPGTYSTLKALDNVSFGFLMDGKLLDYDFEDIDPNLYQLTLSDGTQYEVNQSTGKVTKLTDHNGNVITINSNGLVHSSGKSINFVRDSEGRITSITDNAGIMVNYSYDGHGNLQSVTDAEGNVTKFKYAPDHFLNEIIDPRGVLAVRTEYDDNGRVIRQIAPSCDTLNMEHDIANRREMVTDFDGRRTIYTYDDKGNILTKTNNLNQTWEYTYDKNGHVTSTKEPSGSIKSSLYDDKGNEIEKIDQLGNVVRKTYNEKNKVTSETDPLGRIKRFEYDSKGNLIREIGPDNTVIKQYTYDSYGQVLSETDELGNNTYYSYNQKGKLTNRTIPSGKTEHFSYDAQDNTISHTDFNGNITRFKYDKNKNQTMIIDAGNDTIKTIYNSLNEPAMIIGKKGDTTGYEYDIFGNKRCVIAADGSKKIFGYDNNKNLTLVVDENNDSTVMAYDEDNNLISTTFPDGSKSLNIFNFNNRKIAEINENGHRTEYEYDAAGRNITIRDPFGNETRFEYDDAGNRTARIDARNTRLEYTFDLYNRQTLTTFPDGTTRGVTYDNKGRKIAETDQSGATEQFSYDVNNNLVSVVNADGGTVAYAYDDNSNRIRQTDANNNITSFEYDYLNRLILIKYPDGLQKKYTYDINNNLLTEINENGELTSYEYDCLNREIKKTYASGHVITSTYYPTGRLHTISNNNGVTEYKYDNRGREIKVTNPDKSFIQSTFDLSGNRTAQITPFGTVSYIYDACDRLVRVLSEQGDVTQYFYDPNGNRDSLLLPNGSSSSYIYDPMNRLTDMVNYKADGSVLSSYHYILNPNGLRTGVVEKDGSTVTYNYDNLYRLVQEVRTGTVPYSINYTYDNVGNRLTKSDGVSSTFIYTYNNRDQLIREENENGTTTYNYDSAGRLTQKTASNSVTRYEWIDNNLLHRVVTGDDTVTFGYDTHGRRIYRKNNTKVSNYLIDAQLTNGQVIAESDENGNAVMVYTFGLDRISSFNNSSHFYYFDGQGSVRQITEENGHISNEYHYNAFGEIIFQSGTNDNEFLFTGEQWDPNAGFYYLRARWMDAQNGRFISIDPFEGDIQSPPSLHRYLYAKCDPVNYVDPNGEQYTLSSCMAAVNAAVVFSVRVAIPYAFSISRSLGGMALRQLGFVVENGVARILAMMVPAQGVIRQGIPLVGPNGRRVLDFLVQIGNRIALIEVKYRIPPNVGPAFNRLVSQIQVAATQTQYNAQVVLFTWNAPTQAEMARLLTALGPQASSFQHVNGLLGLVQWMRLFFMIP